MIRTRFAPSPTGYLHIGGLRTALYAYLFAKKDSEGKFILRIEDTDLDRYVEGASELIYFTLKDAGLIYDEGPDVGGSYGPYIQSQRKAIYSQYAQKLVEAGGAYYCFCSKDRLEQMRAGGATKYDKRCAAIPLSEARERIAAGEQYVVRQNIPSKGVSQYEDLVFGKISIDYNDLEDGILIKSDGMPTYNFANVIDDHLMGINYVIRGTEYLSSTPKYNLIYQAFGWELPKYIHLQPIMKNEREKLSKRNGAASYDDFLKKGFLKEAIINYIALLGWSPKEDKEKFSLPQLQERFNLEGLSKSASIFDENKMRWLNSLYIKQMPIEEFCVAAQPWYEKLDFLAGMDTKLLSTLLHSRIETFCDIEKLCAFLTEFDHFDLEHFVNQKWKTDKPFAQKHLPLLLEKIKQNNSLADLHQILVDYAQQNGLKNGQILWVFRIAITGSPVTPGGATEMAELLGYQRVVCRLEKSIKRLVQ